MKKPSIMICMPCYGQSMMMQTARALYDLGNYLTSERIEHRLMMLAAADIEQVRNLFVTEWYEAYPKFSHLLFIDSDMGFEPALIRDMIRFNKPVMGTFYMRRQQEPSVVGLAAVGHSLKDVHQGFLRSNGVGGGVLMISREVIKTMLERLPNMRRKLPGGIQRAYPHLSSFILAFDKIKTDDVDLSEDLSFCQRWHDCDGEIWANVAHKISHIGPFDYHLRYQGILEAKAKAAEAA